jgi:uncharacterized protein YfiM (DUF2279 family)
VLLLVLVAPNPVVAQESTDTSAPCREYFLLSRQAPPTCSELPFDAGRAAAIEAKRYQLLTATAVSAGAIVGGAINAFLDTPHQSFRFTNEGWFGERTFAGGADKASHFVDYSILSKELTKLYDKMGFSKRDSILLGFGVSVTAGLMNEIGDGINPYGFSWEDLTMDVLGAGASAVIAAAELEDLIGFRHGILLPAAGNTYCCVEPRKGRDYANEIYTADLQLLGVGRRLDWNIGPLRYLMVSATYGVKGYPGGAIEPRERQVGLEIGLNFKVILDDLGAGRNTWWGYTLHIIFDNFRVPFTSVGFRYDLNHGRWTGPDNGNGYAAR